MSWASRIFPPVFEEADAEATFLRDFRLAGLTSTIYGCGVAIAGYVLIGSVDIIFDGWSAAAAFRRLLMIFLLSLIILLVTGKPAVVLRRYNLILGTMVLTTYVSAVTMTHLFREDDPTQVVNPTALLGLWIIYGFVRLPLRVTILVGAVGSAFALFGSRVTNMPDPAIRTFVFLLVGNVLGLTAARSVELRERQLFRQKRSLEAAQGELRRRSESAEHAAAEKGRLVTAVAHDLRQPMMAATLHLSVLMRRIEAGDAEGVARQAEKVEESVSHLKETLEHLLLAARYEAGTGPVNVENVSLERILHDLSDLCMPSIPLYKADLIIRKPPKVRLATDSQVLLRALVNLVSNALKFSRLGADRPRVVVRTVVRGQCCHILVVDNGIGISEMDLPGIWRPFYQVGNHDHDGTGGLGLGLYLVKQSVLRLPDHRIEVKSAYGRGTLFTLIAPLSQASPVVLEPAEAALMNADDSRGNVLRGMYVLVVEDDCAARVAIQTLLAEWGVISTGASTVREALSCHAQTDRNVDAIIADYRLAENENGLEAIVMARAALGTFPAAILITADEQVEFDQESLPKRIFVMQKPFEPLALYNALHAALHWALEEELVHADPIKPCSKKMNAAD